MLLRFKVSSLPTAVFPSSSSHIVCHRQTDRCPSQQQHAVKSLITPDSNSSLTSSNMNSLPDGFLVVDKPRNMVVWYTKSGQRAVRMFSDSSKSLGDSSFFSSSQATRAPLDATFCILQEDQYVVVLTTKLSLVMHKIEGIHLIIYIYICIFLPPPFFTSLHFISLHFTSFHFISLHLTSLHVTSLQFISLDFT